jgi:hypothetical protein
MVKRPEPFALKAIAAPRDRQLQVLALIGIVAQPLTRRVQLGATLALGS